MIVAGMEKSTRALCGQTTPTADYDSQRAKNCRAMRGPE